MFYMFLFLLFIFLLIILSLIFIFFIRHIVIFNYIKFLLIVFCVEFLFLFFLYFYSGNYFYVFNYYNEKNIIDREEKVLARKVVDSFSKQILLIKQHLEFNSNNYILWWHLGKLYEIQGLYENSLECFKKAYNICDHDLDLMINYSLVMAKKSNGNLDSDNFIIIRKILSLNPKQIEILNLLAIDAYKNGDYYFAKKNWMIILNEIEENVENKRFIEILKKKIKELSVN